MGKISDALERRKSEGAVKAHIIDIAPEVIETPAEPPRPSPRAFLSNMTVNPKLVVVSAPNSVEAENFKVLRTQLIFPKNGNRPRTMMVTSAFPGEGKTYVAGNLAVSIALGINEHVLLVDCDLRRPGLNRMLGCRPSQGLHDYLLGKRRLDELIMRTEIDKLSFLPAGIQPSNPSELLASTRMKEFVNEVRERYDDRYIIFDTTPSQVTPEATVLANYVDGIILVILAMKSPKEVVKRSVQTLGKDKILGIVFNGYSESQKHYDRYYKKYYKQTP